MEMRILSNGIDNIRLGLYCDIRDIALNCCTSYPDIKVQNLEKCDTLLTHCVCCWRFLDGTSQSSQYLQ